MKYSVSYWCISHIGKVRRINQDNYICDGRFLTDADVRCAVPLCGVKSVGDSPVFGVFDGMGGEECGEAAAYIAAKDASSLTIRKNAASELFQFCMDANGDICRYADENGIISMGTTAAMLAFTRDGVTLCNIGDSKIFRLCGGVLEQISKDHVGVAAFGAKPPLSQNLGIPPTELIIEPYLAQGACSYGDIYLICSDGLTDRVSSEKIAEVLTSGSIDEAGSELLNDALKSGGRDNITIILCKIERESGWFFKRKRKTKEREDQR